MRKLLFVLISLAVVIAGIVLYVGHTGAASVVAIETYTVEKGDTLWDIAKEHAPRNMDVRDYIYRLRKINDMHASATIYPGQELALPGR